MGKVIERVLLVVLAGIVFVNTLVLVYGVYIVLTILKAIEMHSSLPPVGAF